MASLISAAEAPDWLNFSSADESGGAVIGQFLALAKNFWPMRIQVHWNETNVIVGVSMWVSLTSWDSCPAAAAVSANNSRESAKDWSIHQQWHQLLINAHRTWTWVPGMQRSFFMLHLIYGRKNIFWKWQPIRQTYTLIKTLFLTLESSLALTAGDSSDVCFISW